MADEPITRDTREHLQTANEMLVRFLQVTSQETGLLKQKTESLLQTHRAVTADPNAELMRVLILHSEALGLLAEYVGALFLAKKVGWPASAQPEN